MTNRELEFYWMCKQIDANNDAFPTIRDGYLPYKNDAIKLKADILILEGYMPAELIIGVGFTMDQNVAKRNCSQYWDTDVCKIIKGFAIGEESNSIFEQVNFTVSKLERISLPRYYAAISNLNDSCEEIILMTEYIDGGYGVDSGVLTGGMALANTFLSFTGVARQVRSARGQNEVEIRAACKVLQGDLVKSDNDIYGVGNSTFRGTYFRARKIIITILHNIVNVLALDSVSGEPINKVFIINQDGAKGDYTNIDGIKAVYKRPGTNILVFSHKDPITKVVDYIPQTIRVKAIFKGQVDLTIEMVKVVTDDSVRDVTTKAVKKANKKKALQNFAAAKIVNTAAEEKAAGAAGKKDKMEVVKKIVAGKKEVGVKKVTGKK